MNEHAVPFKDFKVIYTDYGYISYHARNLVFKVAKLTYERFEDESYRFVYEPYYDVIDAIDYLDIPGIDLSLREPVYYRTNMTPVFISERVPPKNRVNLIEELKTYDLDYYQPFLMLMDSKRVYGGDALSLRSDDFYAELLKDLKDTKDIYKNISYILRKLAARIDFNIGGIKVDSDNRTLLIRNYMHLYDLVSKHYENKAKDDRGRKRKPVSWVVLRETQKLYKNGLITIDEAVRRSGLGSKRTYYRRVKELEEKDRIDECVL